VSKHRKNRGQIDASNAHIHHRPFSLLDADTSIKSSFGPNGIVRPFVEMIQSCKCLQNTRKQNNFFDFQFKS